MSQVCELCGKRSQIGFNVSHAHNKTKRRFNPNLQSIRIIKNGYIHRIRTCTNCLRSGKIIKPS